MNRIEQALSLLKEKKEKAFITYMTAGLPDMEGTKKLVLAQQEAGVDVIELGIPFSDPVADGPVIQNASYKSICQGTNLEKVFLAMRQMRESGVYVPIIFMMYYNTIQYYGISRFAKECKEAGVDGLIVPDLPFEEQKELKDALEEQDSAILIQLVSPVSGDRVSMILKGARGFVYCVSSMGVTGQSGEFHREVVRYLEEVKRLSDIPVMMGFGIRTPKDIEPMRKIIDGAIVGSHFMTLLEENDYSAEAAKKYCSDFKQKMKI